MYSSIPADVEAVASTVVDAGLKVHSALGPGLLESAYEHCIGFEIERRGYEVRRQLALPIVYDGVKLDAGYRIDLLVAHRVVLEVKAVDALLPLHQAQLLTYLKLSGCRMGFLMNFNVPLFKAGLRRLVI